MEKPSGKFNLRVPPALHKSLKQQARQNKLSLNQWINILLSSPGEVKNDLAPLIDHFKDHLRAVVLFGSTARGERGVHSDIDWLIVLSDDVPIKRSLYHDWDEGISLRLDPLISPQFVHLPKDLKHTSSLWLEVALEGEILYDPSNEVRAFLYKLKNLIANGRVQRNTSNGHSYWVRESEDAK
jgi:predicted nucleotidyltransferase